MSSKECPAPGLGGKFNQHYQHGRLTPGRLSPSSWDDSEEESIETNSNPVEESTNYDRQALDDSDSPGLEDRRQSLARMRRRTKASPDLGSGKRDALVYPMEHSDSPPTHTAWASDWDYVIIDLGKQLNERKFTWIHPDPNESGNSQCSDYPELAKPSDEFFQCDVKSNLSRILETDEPTSKTIRCSENELETQQMNQRNDEKCVSDEVSRLESPEEVPVKFSPTEKTSGSITEEDSSDNSTGMWRRIRDRIKEKNADYAINYDDSRYVSDSLKYIFDGTNDEADEPREKSNPEHTFREGRHYNTDKIEYGNDYSEHSNVQRESKESGAPQQENVFSENSEEESMYRDDGFRNDVPRSGREVFLKQRNSPSRNKGTDSSARSMYTESPRKTGRETEGLYRSSSRKDERGETERSSNGTKKSTSSFRSKMVLDLELSENEDKCSTTERKMFGDSPPEPTHTPTPLTGSPPVRNADSKVKCSKARSPVTRSFRTDACDGKLPDERVDGLGIGDFGDGRKWDVDEINGTANFPKDRGDAVFENRNIQLEWRKIITHLEEGNANGTPMENVFWVDLDSNMRKKFCPSQQHEYTETTEESSMVFHRRNKHFLTDQRPAIQRAPCTNPRTRRMRARKRKRDCGLADKSTTTNPYDDEVGFDLYRKHDVVDSRRSWLVNTFIRNEDMVTRGKRSLHAFLVTRQRQKTNNLQHSSTQVSTPHFNIPPTGGCFRTLFKQFVNIFKFSNKEK